MKLDSYVTLYTRVHSRLSIYLRYNAIKNASKKPIGQSYLVWTMNFCTEPPEGRQQRESRQMELYQTKSFAQPSK